MNKEEILARSRQENNIADERTKYIELKGANFSISIMILLWIAISRIVSLDDKAHCAMGLLVTATCFSNYVYQFARNRTKTVVFFTALFMIAAIIYLVLFLRFSLNLF